MGKVKGGKNFYGEVLGILLLETRFPRLPGDVGNATSYDFPVRFKVVKGASLKNVVLETDETLVNKFIEAAKELEVEGVRAITTSCGFLVLFQDEIAQAVRIPVFTSSLLMVPLVHKMTAGRVGIVTANSRNITGKHLDKAGIDTNKIPIAIAGLENKEEFSKWILHDSPEMDAEKVEMEVVEVTEDLITKYDDIKAVVFECHNLSPFSHAVQERLSIPIFDFITFANFVYNAVVKRRFIGYF
jgi:Asp/Glu/hydantoin racemase